VDVEDLGRRIIAARESGELLDAPLGDVDTETAYAVQEMITDWRLGRGVSIAGWKLGYTSAAMREQMGIAEPNYGPLMTDMIVPSGAVIDSGVVHPRVEPEIAAVLARDVSGPDDVGGAVAQWRLALEVVDSVWRDYRFDWALNTADGSSAAYAVVGDAVTDLADLVVEVDVAGEARQGRADAAMGDPRNALRWLAEQLIDHPRGLRAGDVVITGGLTPALALPVGGRAIARAGDASAIVTFSP